MIARIKIWHGGTYGKSGEIIAEISPQYTKTGRLKKSVFTVERVIKVIEKGYSYGAAKTSMRIAEVLDK